MLVHAYVTEYRLGIYNTHVLPWGTSWLLKRHGRVLDFRSKGPQFDHQPGHGDFFKESVTNGTYRK